MIPSDEQAVVIAHPLQPVRVAAGAGTGKTTTLAARIVQLVGEGAVMPEQVLGITFTNKAAQELADRIRTSLAGTVAQGREVDIHTYHGFASRLLHEFGALVGVERQSKVITPTYARQLLWQAMGSGSYQHLDITNPRTVEKLARLAADLSDNLLEADAVATDRTDEPWPERRELAATLLRYEEEKRRLGVVDYGDLIRLAHRLVSEHPQVGARYRQLYRVVLLDEYQDTNPAQRELLRITFGSGFPVTAVGDPDQTIYEWRGASLENFAGFPHHFPRPDGSPAPTLPLTLNRRSGSTILDLANSIRVEIGGETGDLQPLPEAGPGLVATHWTRTAIDEANFVAEQLSQLHREGYPWSEMAVLFRKNKDMALIHDALEEHGIPVEVANLGGLLGIPEVNDIYAWLRILANPDDAPALMRILLGSRYRLGMADLLPLSRWVRSVDRPGSEVDGDHERLPGRSMVEAIDRQIEGVPDRAAAPLAEFRRLYRTLLQEAQGLSLVELVRTILSRTGAWQEVEAMGESSRLSARLNLYRFLDLAEQWSPLEGRPSLGAFLDYLQLLAEDQTEELDTARLSGEEAVVLLTVHRAKGLEWPVVFIPAVVHNNFPTSGQTYPDPIGRAEFLPHELRIDRDAAPRLGDDLTEDERKAVLRQHHLRQEWRIAYVAATRAAARLYLSGAYWYGVPEPRKTTAKPSALFELARAMPATVDLGLWPEPGPRPEVMRFEPMGDNPADPTFPGGWDEGLREAVDDPNAMPRRAVELGTGAAYDEAVESWQQLLLGLTEPSQPPSEPAPPPLSVTGLVTYATCPLRYFWSEVDRLPRRPSPAARRGVEIHRRIELHNRGFVPLEEATPELYDLEPAELGSAPATRHPFEVFRNSRFAQAVPRLVEAPFDLVLGEVRVRGRIDAVYEHDPGWWEVVDFKSGRPSGNEAVRVQLQAYALAVADAAFGAEVPERTTVTFAYLGDELEEVSDEVDEDWLGTARNELEALITSVAADRFEPTPSEACHTCDFSRFCEAGRTWLEGSE